ncbi:hypothetical protein MNBD_GAMMA11-555 [hydrothermal vent metagenome]|uniref:SPOR domain-containing protein n=1 Tax=hydrothermal vent metagenome TaxID=652676 RepID=A0A3B0X826_9ZZZZ
MRILLIIVIALNLLYAAWEYRSPVVRNHAQVPLADSLNSLELLHEINRAGRGDSQGDGGASGLEDLAEQTGDEVSQGEDEETGVETARPVEPESSSVACYTLGPFKDESIMQQLKESIAEHVAEIAVRKRQQSEKHRYWVYLPGLLDRQEAKAMAKKLRGEGIKDFYIVLSGKKKNSISLGHYREPNHANRRVKSVIALGFNAEIDVIYREYDIYWLDYKIEEAEDGNAFSMDEYITEGVSRLDREC